VIELSSAQLSFAEGLIQEEVGPLYEDWMRQVDEILFDPELLSVVYDALAQRWPKWTMEKSALLIQVRRFAWPRGEPRQTVCCLEGGNSGQKDKRRSSDS
jgi:hypothetical protein